MKVFCLFLLITPGNIIQLVSVGMKFLCQNFQESLSRVFISSSKENERTGKVFFHEEKRDGKKFLHRTSFHSIYGMLKHIFIKVMT
jgi:hypothetical protein